MTDTTDALVEVTQEDREAAKHIATAAMRYFRHALKHDIAFNTLLKAVEPDVARHRIAAVRKAEPVIAAAREVVAAQIEQDGAAIFALIGALAAALKEFDR